MAPDRISRVAVDDDGNVLGWVGAINIYNGNVWDLHPLAVRPDRQRQGIGRALIEDMAEQAKARGGCTLWVGSEDHGSQTSLGGANLYPDLLARLAAIEDLRDHPYGFYLKAGFHLAGVLPDACGPGQPDIFLARSL